MESVAPAVRRRQLRASHDAAMDRQGRVPGHRAVLIANCDELGGVNWEWQNADGAMGKAVWGISSAPIPRIAANQAPNAA